MERIRPKIYIYLIKLEAYVLDTIKEWAIYFTNDQESLEFCEKEMQ